VDLSSLALTELLNVYVDDLDLKLDLKNGSNTINQKAQAAHCTRPNVVQQGKS